VVCCLLRQTKEDIGFRRRLGIAIAGVGKQKPPHANDGSGWTSAAALESLTTVVNFATKVSGREFSDAAWGVMWSLLRSLRVVGHVPLQGQQAADAATVGKLFGDAVAKFATEKSCCLSATVRFGGVIDREW
jgi:cell division ATPase FtsA